MDEKAKRLGASVADPLTIDVKVKRCGACGAVYWSASCPLCPDPRYAALVECAERLRARVEEERCGRNDDLFRRIAASRSEDAPVAQRILDDSAALARLDEVENTKEEG